MRVRKSRGGRPPKDDKLMIEAMYYVLRTGIPWRDLPRVFGPWSLEVGLYPLATLVPGRLVGLAFQKDRRLRLWTHPFDGYNLH